MLLCSIIALVGRMGLYARPTRIEDAIRSLSAGPATILAGGTDVYPARVGRPIDGPVLDVTAIDGLRGIASDGSEYRIGALTTWTDLIEAPLPPLFDGFKNAARAVGGAQIQNAGTLAGNLCNASPAADGTPNLLVLDALVELASAGGTRRMPVADFVLGNRKTAREADELVTALVIPPFAQGTRSSFQKLGSRAYLVISIVMVAVVLEPAPDGTVGRLHVAVGACSAVPQRLVTLEADLMGAPITPALARRVEPRHLDGLSPINDVRATAAYRRDAALTLVRRAIQELVVPHA